MTAQPVHGPDPDDPGEILRILPARWHEEFLGEYRAALPLFRRLGEDQPRVSSYSERAAALDNNLSVVLRRLGRPAEARDHAERAVAIQETLVKQDPRTTAYRGGLAENYLNRGLARISGLAGQAGSGVSAGEASSAAESAMTLLRKAVGVGYRNPDAYRTEDALDPLRGRDDFRLLMMDIAFPGEPFAPGR